MGDDPEARRPAGWTVPPALRATGSVFRTNRVRSEEGRFKAVFLECIGRRRAVPRTFRGRMPGWKRWKGRRHNR